MQSLPITVHKNVNRANPMVWIVEGETANCLADVKNEIIARALEMLIGKGFSVRMINNKECKVLGVNEHDQVETYSYDYMMYNSTVNGNCIGFYLRGSTDEYLKRDIHDPKNTDDGFVSVDESSYKFIALNT